MLLLTCAAGSAHCCCGLPRSALRHPSQRCGIRVSAAASESDLPDQRCGIRDLVRFSLRTCAAGSADRPGPSGPREGGSGGMGCGPAWNVADRPGPSGPRTPPPLRESRRGRRGLAGRRGRAGRPGRPGWDVGVGLGSGTGGAGLEGHVGTRNMAGTGSSWDSEHGRDRIPASIAARP